jgi:hypothetical protein
MYLNAGKMLAGGSGRRVAVAGYRHEFRARRLGNGVGVMTAPQTVAYQPHLQQMLSLRRQWNFSSDREICNRLP